MGVDPDFIDAAWDALKERCCSDPSEAKRCVMVGQDDFRAALLSASTLAEAATRLSGQYVAVQVGQDVVVFDAEAALSPAPAVQEGK